MAGSIPILNMRLTLARLASESTILEGELWLTMGKKVRKGELYHIASNALTHALLFQRKKLFLLCQIFRFYTKFKNESTC